jgi:hypothetical protein
MSSCINCGQELTTDAEINHGICYDCATFDLDDDDYEDDDDFYERLEEQKQEELWERAHECTCGAWQHDNKGNVFHVADCCCGAE